MPTLTWNGKKSPDPQSATLVLDSIVCPAGSPSRKSAPKNKLYVGDNLSIMAALLPEYDGSIDLIYADPPFFTNRKFPARIGRGEDSRKPREWLMAEGYHDHWPSLDDYLDFLYSRLCLMHRLLSSTGTLYLHLDWHADAYARLLLDEIFGADHLLNTIAWLYHGPSPIKKAFNRKHDTILVYRKGVISITDGQIYLEADLFYKGIRPALNVGISVSRVGSSAQIKAMKKVAGRLRLDIAQFRELEAFAQFGSDLDEKTRQTIERGKRTVEVLKQDQYKPMAVENQVAIIYAVTNGFMDDVEIAKAKDWERDFHKYLKSSRKEILKLIADKKELTEEVIEKLEKCIKEFKEVYSNGQ